MRRGPRPPLLAWGVPATLALALLLVACGGGSDRQSAAGREPLAPGPAADAEAESKLLRQPFPWHLATDISTIQIDNPVGPEPLWAVASQGRVSASGRPYFLTVYRTQGGTLQEIARLELETRPDFLYADLRQVEIAPGEIWLAVRGGAENRDITYELVSFDGVGLRSRLSAAVTRPGGVQLRDVDGDGGLEVVVINGNPSVLGSAGLAIQSSLAIFRWDGSELVPVALAPLNAAAPTAAREAVDRAITFAAAGLWIDAVAAIDEAVVLAGDDQTLPWTALLIHENATLLAAQEAHPLLDPLFVGDYEGADALLRRYQPAALFASDGPLLSGPAANRPADLGRALVGYARRAVEARPELASAYFLLGLGEFLLNPSNAAVVQAHLEQALALAPGDALYAPSLVYLVEQGG